MLVEEIIFDGKVVKHYSNDNKMIRQIETSILYIEANDRRPCKYTYEESDMNLPPERPEQQENESDEDYQKRINEYEQKYTEWVAEYERREAERIKAEEEARKKAEEEARKKAEEEAQAKAKQEYNQELDVIKEGKIAESKINLRTWLENHPYSFTKSDGTVGLYAVTEEKQQLLALEIMTDQMMIQVGLECQPTWNATGKVCENWTIEELQSLAVEISKYVKPRVSIQQHKEAEIMAYETKESVLAINVGVEIYD